MKKCKLIKRVILIIILMILLLYIFPSLIINFIYNEKVENHTFSFYNLKDLYSEYVENQEEYNINLTDRQVIYDDTYFIQLEITNYLEDSEYDFEVYLEGNMFIDEKVDMNITKYEINLVEGKNIILIKIYKNGEIKINKQYILYRVEPYEKQFLDELSKNGITVHYRDGTKEDYEKSKNLLSALGVKFVRADFLQSSIEKNNEYNFSSYDKWVKDLTSTTDIKILAILNGLTKDYGSDKKINSDKEIDLYINFFKNVQKHYPEIVDYEIMNELNLYSPSYKGAYFTEEEMVWYSKLINELEQEVKNSNIDIMTAGTTTPSEDSEDRIMSEKFYTFFYNTGGTMTCNNLSVNPYSINNIENLKLKLKKHEILFNSFGGFNNININEYGCNVQYVSEESQAFDLIKQTATLEDVANFKILYNLWTTGEENSYEQFGLLRKDYSPRPSYYAMKNYYENTNGSEYIGTISLADGLETHVYNKDGKPKIVTWSNTKDQTIQIDYANFTAKDLYGNDIENTNGKLDITTSPVYLDNISTKYFYEAISNTALEKYSEFEEKFATEIASVDGLQENINTLKQYLESISNIEKESEETAKQKMQEHFNLGNQILTAYKDKALDVEYVKLSSMLDMLNEIGDSFEDLVTVTAKTRNPDLENTKILIDNTEQAINNNNDLDIAYPEKILEFSKELYEDSEYINSLEEENDIKTGLIVSYDLHAKYLADWANTFTNLYIDKYIEDNPVTESYSATSLTNQDVTVTLNIPQDVKITNNEGSNTYTFTENGTFTFEYERRGKTDSKLVSVNYIDKTSPEITNVENGEVYTQSIIPNASDEHLDKVQLTFRGQVIEDYEVGDELTEEGDYKLTATDTVGNTSTVKFYIMKEDSTYKIKDSNILNIRPETTVKDFKENFTVIEGYTIKREDTELTDEDVISTGDVLEETDGNKFTLIVRGDLNCDGRLSIVDLSIERKYLLEIIDIDENQKLSSDMNTDEETSLMDLSIMRKTILGIIK